MYFKRTLSNDLSRAEIEEVRRAFLGLLHRRRYSPQFIANNADELLSIAHTEYVRAIDKGVEIEDAVAWTINCAWRRTQNHLTAEGRRPRLVSTEKVLDLADESRPTPAALAEDEDRARKIRDAVAELEETERQLIALTYFEGMTVAEAGRLLKIHPSKAKHTHGRALRHLFASLGVKRSDELEISIGLAAYLSFADPPGLHSLPAGLEVAADKAGQAAQGFWVRLHDGARRVTVGGGGDAAGAVASSGAGRAAGVCAAGVAVVCFGAASGVIGPGIGAVDPGGDHHDAKAPRISHRAAVAPAPRHTGARSEPPAEVVKPDTRTVSSTTSATAEAPRKTKSAGHPKRSQRSTSEGEATPPASEAEQEVAQVEEQVSGIARAAAESPPAPSVGGATSSESEGASPAVTVTPGASGGSSAAEKAQVKEEFGGFTRDK